MAPKNNVAPFEEFIPWAIRPLARRIFRQNNNNGSSRSINNFNNNNKKKDTNPFFSFFSPKKDFDIPVQQQQQSKEKEFYKFSKLEDISIEYLEIICKDFTPYELISLAGTCKRLRNLLMSDDNQVQSIWRNSRLQHMRYLQLPPPYLLTEQEYIGLTMIERGCQFCGQRKNWVRVYWKYQVRSCYECYKPRFLKKNGKQNRRDTPETQVYLADIKNREMDDRKQLKVTIADRKQKLTNILHELESETVEEDGCTNIRLLFKYDPKLLKECHSFNAEWRLYDQPFTLRDESRLRKLMDEEYKGLVEKLYTNGSHSVVDDVLQ